MVLHAGPSDRGRPAQPQDQAVWEHWAAECADKREHMDHGTCSNCQLFQRCQKQVDALICHEVNQATRSRYKKAKKAKKEKVH
jgi:hypothetical protein